MSVYSVNPDTDESHGASQAEVTVPSHTNDIGDWCPWSGMTSPDGTCPIYCREG